MTETTHDPAITVIYDGDCPFCRRYVAYYHLKERFGIRLVNARDGVAVPELEGKNIDLNKGMVVIYRGEIYHGAMAVHLLAELSGDGSPFSRLNQTIFRHKPLAVALYPLLRAGRAAALFLTGKKPI